LIVRPSKSHRAVVIDLARVRSQRRVQSYYRKMSRVIDSNQRALGRLFTTRAIFSREGARVGRDLLLAHQHLLRVVELLECLGRSRRAGRSAGRVDLSPVLEELDGLLERTFQLTSRTGEYLERLRME
jgi:hypothetical protein